MQPDAIENPDVVFELMWRDWTRVLGIRPAADPAQMETQFLDLSKEHSELRSRGLWASGPVDVMSVLGRQRDELAHSRFLAWLLTPTARHRLGSRFLEKFLHLMWPDDEFPIDGLVLVDREVPRVGYDESKGVQIASQADVVIRLEGITIILENKVDAGEGDEQCERLYWSWATEPGDVRWVFLTPTGRSPITTRSTAAQSAWRNLSYRSIQAVLDGTLANAPDDAGVRTARQYAHTLKSILGNPEKLTRTT